MTLEQALHTLGLPPEAGPQDARAAYLTRLRAHRPESDPAGFARLRAAYERVKEGREASRAGRLRLPTSHLSDPLRERLRDLSPLIPREARPLLDALPAGAAAVRAAELLVERGLVDTALHLVVFSLEAHGRALNPPPPSAVVRLVLLLHARNHLEAALEIEARLRRWLEATGQEARQCVDRTAVLWAVAKELSALGAELPPPMRAAMAWAALIEDVEHAAPKLQAFTLAHPSLAYRAIMTLESQAPTLWGLWGQALRRGRRRWRGRLAGVRQRALLLTGAMALLWSGGHIWMLGATSTTYEIHKPQGPLERASAAARTVCARAGSNTEACDRALAVSMALQEGRCAAAHQALEQAGTVARHTGDPYAALRAAVTRNSDL